MLLCHGNMNSLDQTIIRLLYQISVANEFQEKGPSLLVFALRIKNL